jgi:hypothetical protein
MVQGLDLPVVADEFGELGRGGLLGGQADDGVDRLDGGLADLAVGAAALDLDGLAGTGEEEAVHGGDLDPAGLRAAVADAAGAYLKRNVFPGKGLELPTQLLLVALDDHDVVGVPAEEVVGVLALGVHRVARDEGSCQVGDGVQQQLEAGDLVRLLADVQLG